MVCLTAWHTQRGCKMQLWLEYCSNLVRHCARNNSMRKTVYNLAWQGHGQGYHWWKQWGQ